MTVPSVFGFILALLVVGRLLRARGVVPANAPDTLNAVALYVCLPASIFLNAPQLRFQKELAAVVGIPWLLLVLAFAIVWPLTRLLGSDRATRACLLTEIPTGNTAFMGYAVIPALAGAGALRYAVIYDQFGMFLIVATYVLFVVAVASGRERPTAAAIAKRVVGFPPFLSLVFALVALRSGVPEPARRPLEILAAALLPIVALALGMQLRLRLPRAYVAPIGIAFVGKLGVMPLAALGLCALFGLTGEMRAAVVLESAMPTMMTTGALLSMAGLAPDLAAAIIGYTTIGSMITLPLWKSALGL